MHLKDLDVNARVVLIWILNNSMWECHVEASDVGQDSKQY